MDHEVLFSAYRKIKHNNPLIHNITNYVAMNTTANALLAIGASPVMAHAPEEVEAMTTLARALVINIGTLSAPWVASMKTACVTAQHNNIPIVLDPVGAGATPFRTQTAHHFIEQNYPTIVRGNASEIGALLTKNATTHGVDSTLDGATLVHAAQRFAKQTGIVLCISGKIDYITNGHTTYAVANGHELMTRVTGMGCITSALMGAFATVTKPCNAALYTMVIAGIAGEKAAHKAHGPGSFTALFIDALATLTLDDVQKLGKVDDV